MDGEQRRDQRARPRPAAEPAQREKQQHAGGRVQEHVDQQVAAGVQAEELHVEHV
jgi:hypothetical protein